jgi:anti-sigma regulatory factor (Ser/Thr protein kinase)
MQPRLISRHEQLPATPASVGAARRLVRKVAADAADVDDDILEAAELLVSELVSNAVMHAGTPIDLMVSVSDGPELTVNVSDGSPHQPVPRHYERTASTGRGLRLVEDLSDEWGVTVRETGKTVWFRVSRARAGQAGQLRRHSHGASPHGDTVMVELLGVPLLLHARWQQQAEALLREYLLFRLEEGAAESEVLRHSECSDAVALLAEAIPLPEEWERDPQVDEELPRATVAVPRASVPHIATLDATLDQAIALADSDALLTVSSSPEARAFRRWVCRQVAEQSAGAPPTPWKAP